MNISYHTIDLDEHYGCCHQFRRDSYYCSFGSYNGFDQSIVGYEGRIKQRLMDKRWQYQHIWIDQEIIGQLEFRSFSNKPNTGYVHLIYLVQGFRGLGVADEAQKFIFQVLREQGCQAAMLSVSRANERAVRHYTRTGWSYLAPNPKHELTDFYTRQFS